jgi:drug/metabolite transporter (DMT)-like permease
MSQAPTIVWMVPTLLALLTWGLGQGFVKKYIAEVPPARFCLFFVFAKAAVNIGYFLSQDHPAPFAPEGATFMSLGLLAYVLDGTAWIFYFLSIVAGPITIVGTLSAAYPAITILLARIFLAEVLTPTQYFGVVLVILACIGLSYDPNSGDKKKIQKRWVPYATLALLLWGTAQVIVKHAYSFPAASDANMALFNTMGGMMTLGVYGFLFGRQKGGSFEFKTWLHSFLPMGLLASGDLLVIVALSKGPSSIISPVSGAYPLVTLIFAWLVLKEKIGKFQWACIIAILTGITISQ